MDNETLARLAAMKVGTPGPWKRSDESIITESGNFVMSPGYAYENGAEILELNVENTDFDLMIEAWRVPEMAREILKHDKEVDEILRERDDAFEVIRRIHIALGGDGEWCAKPGSVCAAGDTGDLCIDAPVLAEELKIEHEEMAQRIRELEQLEEDVEHYKCLYEIHTQRLEALHGKHEALQQECDRLQAEVDDWRNSAEKAAEEGCGDEKHCACVPLLRTRLLRAMREE